MYIKQKMSKDLTTFIFDLSRKTHNFAKTNEVKSPIKQPNMEANIILLDMAKTML